MLYAFSVKSEPQRVTHLAEKLDEDRFRDVISGHPFTPSAYPRMSIIWEGEVPAGLTGFKARAWVQEVVGIPVDENGVMDI